LAMANTPYTIHQSRCLVVGYGRIGKLLSEDLRALGADVTATARKHSDLAWIEARGFKACRTEKLADIAGGFDIIFNTVPHPVINFKVLSATRPEVLIIDLASKPGGVDFDTAKELGRRVIWALSLPGKAAPLTAGRIIKNTLMNILEELGV
ncbi:MAG: NAD(P)-dependent oxidoreductase, partial [Monoglobaceae bacterium]